MKNNKIIALLLTIATFSAISIAMETYEDTDTQYDDISVTDSENGMDEDETTEEMVVEE